jgi:Lrp/AsnC family transcriptional regulator, leucine-responsive regulatory protein
MDKIDHSILCALQADARMPVTALAEHIALSATPVTRRIKAMEADGYITGYTTRMDAKKLGFSMQAFVLANLKQHNDETIDRFEAEVGAMESVIACFAVTGDMDYILHIVARDVDHLNEIVLKRLVRIEGVGDVKSILVLQTVKQGHAVPLNEMAARA